MASRASSSGGGGGRSYYQHPQAKEERVTYTADPSHPDRFVPRVSAGAGGEPPRRFEPEDLSRVLDFEGLSFEPPKDGGLMLGEDGGTDGLKFPVYHFCLRGGYLFYFSVEDVDEESGPFVIFHGPPVGVIPLERVIVEFPPGGRRVFREHAHTDARSGYEMVVLHVPYQHDDNNGGGGEGEEMRPPAFLVAESLGARERWAKALRERASVAKPTLLRSGYVASSSMATTSKVAASTAATSRKDEPADGPAGAAVSSAAAGSSTAPGSSSLLGAGGGAAAVSAASVAALAAEAKDKNRKSKRRESASHGKPTSSSASDPAGGKALDSSRDDAELGSAILEFGSSTFSEKEWMDNYFATHNDFDVPTKCRQMENHQNEMKKSLKGAVLEQYEYFVQASGEMTTMGREVASLKSYIETEVETLKDMKEVDFSGCVHNRFLRGGGGSSDDTSSDAMEPPRLDRPASVSEQKSAEAKKDDRSFLSDGGADESYPSFRRGGGRDASRSGSKAKKAEHPGEDAGNESMETSDPPSIQIPEWLEDVTVDIAALAREGQYTDAIELHVKARNEVLDLLDKHERPTSYKLSRRQLHDLKKLHKALDQLGKRISGRLEETLRRKNEALRQAAKRERSDPSHTAVTVVSPCALRDDALFLQLLVKLGQTQVAAEAYSARRSLLLLESLNERPISGAGSVDLVIYSAQLSQSFFSCLAYSVEGFLDLFMSSTPAADYNKAPEDSDSLADSSVHSQSMKTNNAPSGAVSSVVLWCDAELSKFAAAFGGNRVLANLPLSPPPRDNGPKKPRVVGEDETNKDRKGAVEVAAQCVDQAFLYATQNLDSVGLPLAPRLAEYIRVRLKGCEDEVAQLLGERWQHLTVDWRTAAQQTNGGTFLGRGFN
jgi:hypothetical protein